MGFCGNCGEIIGRTGRCLACKSDTGPAVNPVSGTNDPEMAKEFDYGGHTLAAPFERRGSINNVWSKGDGGWKTGNETEDGSPQRRGSTNRNCAGCGLRLDPMSMVHACGKDWHEACFVCGVCAKPLGSSPFVVKGGLPYHKECYATASADKCAKCKEPLVGTWITADGVKYHKDCFTCTTCGSTLETGYVLRDDLPYCGVCATEAKRSQQAAAAAAFRAELGGVERGIEHADTGLAAMGLKTSGEDRFLIDIKTGEQIFVEKEGGRKYRLGSNGGKLYEDEKPKKKCDLPTTFRHLPTTSPPYRLLTATGWQINLLCLSYYDHTYSWQVRRRHQLDDVAGSDDQGRCRGGARGSTQNLSILRPACRGGWMRLGRSP